MLCIIKTLKEKLNNHKFILACSTGSDSMALFDLCLKAGLKDNMIVCHVNHGLRIESNEEQQYIESLCKELSITCKVKVLSDLSSIDGNMEQTARIKRYEFFIDCAKENNCDYILTAHQANDQIETILMRLLKSSSLRSYGGIEKETTRDNITIYRPLLDKSKEEILEYVNTNQIKYYDDYTNFEDEHLRNRIRKYITPLLLKENPNIYESFNYFSQMILNADNLLEKEINSFINNKVLITSDYSKFSIKDYLLLDNWLAYQILFRILKPYNLSIKLLNDIDSLIRSDNLRIINNINNQLSIVKEYGYIYILNSKYEEITYYNQITSNGIYILPNNYTIEVLDNQCILTSKKTQLCYNIYNINVPFIIRSRKPGDVIERHNKEQIYKQKITNYLTTKKIPSIIKQNLLLIEKDEKVVNVIGLHIK